MDLVNGISARGQIGIGVNTLTSAGPEQSGGRPVTDGMKIRARWRPRAPTSDTPLYTAVNVELAQLSIRFYPGRTSAEVKFIGVYQTPE